MLDRARNNNLSRTYGYVYTNRRNMLLNLRPNDFRNWNGAINAGMQGMVGPQCSDLPKQYRKRMEDKRENISDIVVRGIDG